MKHLIMLLATIAVFTHSSTAQYISDFDVRHYNTENGLPQNSIKAIASDEYGFIWLASEAGLLRYDGGRFKVHSKREMDIPTSRIITLTQNPVNGHLLAISDLDRTLLSIEHGKVRAYNHNFASVFFPDWNPANQPQNRIRNLPFVKYKKADSLTLVVGKGLTALVTLNGVYWYRKGILVSQISFAPMEDFASVFIMDNKLYIAHKKLITGVLERVDTDKISQVKIAGDFLKQINDDESGETFFETNPATHTTFLFSGKHLYLLNQLPDGSLNTELLLSGFDLVAHQISCTYYNPVQGRIFLGSRTEGLFILSRKRFFTALYPGKDPFINVLYSLVPLNDNSLLTGVGTVFFTKKQMQPGSIPLLREGANLGYVLFRSTKNEIWFSNNQFVYQMDHNALKIIRRWPVAKATSISENKKGDIWIGMINSGIYLIDRTERLTLVLPVKEYILFMEWETDSLCWISTDKHLFRFHPQSGKMDTFPLLNNKIVRSIYIPRQDEVWLCTYENGLYLWKDSKLTSFSTNEYPALQTVHKILEDQNGFFWISTNDGLYQVSRADLLHHSTDPTFQPYFFRYSSEDGFLTNEFNGSRQYAGTKLADGFFAFPSMKGVVFFKPDVTLPELPDKPIIIDRIMVDGQEKNPGQYPITIERGFEQITITPATAYLGNASNLKYQFNLNNSNKWQALTGGSVVFSALPSRENHLTIRKRSGFGNSGYTYCHLVIYVPPAWWERTWFYIALIIVLALLFWFVIRLRTRYWRRRSQSFEEAVQNRMVELNDMILELELSEEKLSEQLHFQRMLNENITHDVNAPLKYLTIYTGEMVEHVRNNKLPDINEVEHIHSSTNSIYALVENLTQFLKTKYRKPTLSSINVWQLVQQKLDMFSIGAKRKNILLKNEIDHELFIHQNETLLGILLHNLIDNAIKNTVRGSVLITSRPEENGKVSLHLKDTGRGLSEEQVQQYNAIFSGAAAHKSDTPPGFGFIIVKEIAKILHVSIHIESVLNNGTEITVTVSE